MDDTRVDEYLLKNREVSKFQLHDVKDNFVTHHKVIVDEHRVSI